jgi:hypothetical protein
MLHSERQSNLGYEFWEEPIYGETLQRWDDLRRIVDGVKLSDDTDRVRWKIGTSGAFRVKDLYLQLREEGRFPRKFLWKIKIPMKVLGGA